MTPELIVADATAWLNWLREHHEASDGIWLVLAKKNVTTPTSLSYDEALEEALCHGWIDGQRRGVYRWMNVCSSRPRSLWSKRNVDLVARMETEGRMRPAGRAQVELAKADGRWDKAYDGSRAQEVPPDLAAALAAEPKAQAMFEILTSANRFAVVFRVNDAKRPETRAKRIALYVEQLSRGETIYPQKRRL